MEPRRLPERETEDKKPQRSVDAPSVLWWMLAVIAIIAFSGLAFLLGRAT